MPESEILIHIAAPSTVRDDARYRAQVEAILAFQASTRQVITLRSDKDHADDNNVSAQSIGSTTASGSTASTDSEGTGVDHELDTSAPQIPSWQPETIQSLPRSSSPARQTQYVDSLGTPISVVPDSQPGQGQQDTLALQEIASPVTATSHAHRSTGATTEAHTVKRSSVDLSAPESEEHDNLPGRVRDEARSAPPQSDLALQEPESPVSVSRRKPVPQIVDAPPAKRNRADPPRIPENGTSDNPLTRRQHKQSRKQSRHDNKPSTSPSLEEFSVHDTPGPDAPFSTENTLVTTPVKIQPPLPPISRSPFESHITPTLSMLVTRLRSGRTYTPVKQFRDLDALERGYWFLLINLVPDDAPLSAAAAGGSSINTHTIWDITLFNRFWTFLSEFISEGRAGWGVWCILEDAPSPAPLQPGNRATASAATPSSGTEVATQRLTLKVYAWGEVALHVYLLLFLASERRIRRMGAQWRDGGDVVIIEMP
ncbi:uncharacterized protein BP01DRAFT_358065 [Aspergillus saccharolyticus JOP 1030-1]|uniref:Acetamidase n=1 Tax=Aspergillus saccharolyticus JOP 1030-1 TaxID=1450539 RepID=A0A318Z924_9EURO|nr:hypothetical protein BP01DRAFT_358065 [Aspergillus saccharolyticus JOP 1030-1]PYH43875.1 hypothetical protein BP01DRAFT_358065 [Aspergillus saccharolyticus JOP 1030-1]